MSSGHRRPGARQYIVGIQSSITIICVEERVSHDNTGPIDGERRLMEWIQAYDPLPHVWLSTLAAAVPIVLLFTWMVPSWA